MVTNCAMPYCLSVRCFTVVMFGAMIWLASSAEARDRVRVVGSSTVYPFATAVADQLSRSGGVAPIIESTGTGGGMKLFCDGVGSRSPDIVTASRPMQGSEWQRCTQNNVTGITEIRFGLDGIVLAQSHEAKKMSLTRASLFLAAAKQVPAERGDVRQNPYRRWSQIDSELPDQDILIYGPPPSSGTRDALVEIGLVQGALSFVALRTLEETNPKQFRRISQTVREDGVFVEAGENDNLIVRKLQANPLSIGIFGYSFLENNLAKVRAIPIDGVEPDYDTIADGTYPLARPLFFYVKKQHVGLVPGLQEFVDLFVSEQAIGEDGWLADLGLVALPEKDQTGLAGWMEQSMGSPPQAK